MRPARSPTRRHRRRGALRTGAPVRREVSNNVSPINIGVGISVALVGHIAIKAAEKKCTKGQNEVCLRRDNRVRLLPAEYPFKRISAEFCRAAIAFDPFCQALVDRDYHMPSVISI